MNIKEYQSNRFELGGIVIHNVFIKVRPLGSDVTSSAYDEEVPGLIIHSSVKSSHRCMKHDI